MKLRPNAARHSGITFTVLSVLEVEKYLPVGHAILISIRDPGTPSLNWSTEIYSDVLEIEFEDVVPQDCVFGQYELFSDNHARDIVSFMSRHQDGDIECVIHCQAGFSRSPAIAIALSEWLAPAQTPGLQLRFPGANKHVIEVMRRVLLADALVTPRTCARFGRLFSIWRYRQR